MNVASRLVDARLGSMPVAYIVAIAAGAALPLAFAPFGWAWVAFLSPAVLFAVVSAAPRRVALWSAYLFGLGYFGVGVSWVYISVSRYGSGPLLAVVVTSLFVALLALFPWLAVYTVRRLRPQMDGLALWLGLPAAWVLSEWLRLWFLTGFPWLFLGYSQTDTLLADIAPVFGVLGVSLVVAVLAGALAWAALRLSPARAGACALAFGAMLGAAWLFDRDWTRPLSEPISVALLQGNIEQDKKWDPRYRALTLERYRALTERHWGAKLIIWPEAAVPAWYDQVADDYLAELRADAAEAGSALLLGVPVREEDGRAYNAVVSLTDQPGFYYKRHLVPFGEYIPLRDLIGRALDILGAPMSDFSSGTEARLLSAAGLPVGAFICYEAVFAPEVAALLPAAALLVNVSNDAWFGDSLGPQQHFQMARLRAIETGRDLLRATNTGITAAVDHKGRVLARAPQFEVASLTAEVTPRAGATPYVRWLDWPVLILSVAALGLLLTRRVRPRGTMHSAAVDRP
jgi:apolipoprotein N-acyltransferase